MNVAANLETALHVHIDRLLSEFNVILCKMNREFCSS